MDIKDRIKGCIYGSANGDSIGLDTQQLLFTINGILYGETRLAIKGIGGDMSKWIFLALKDWYKLGNNSGFKITWLSNVKELSDTKKGSNSTLDEISKLDINTVGTVSNDRGECDVLSRSIGISLCYFNSKSTKEIFELGMKVCGITHGSELAKLSCGFLSSFVSLLLSGKDLDSSFKQCLELLNIYSNVLSKDLERAVYSSDISNMDSSNANGCLCISLYYIFKNSRDGINNSTVNMIVNSVLGIDSVKEEDNMEYIDTLSNDVNIFVSKNDYIKSEGWEERYVNTLG